VEGPLLDDENGLPTKETQETSFAYDDVVSSTTKFISGEHGPGVKVSADGLEFTWTAKEGAYALCLDNTMSQIQSKVVDVSASGSLSKSKPVEDGEIKGVWLLSGVLLAFHVTRFGCYEPPVLTICSPHVCCSAGRGQRHDPREHQEDVQRSAGSCTAFPSTPSSSFSQCSAVACAARTHHIMSSLLSEDLLLLQKSADRIGSTLKEIQEKQLKERHRLALQTAGMRHMTR
jgi:hypothetical protein